MLPMMIPRRYVSRCHAARLTFLPNTPSAPVHPPAALPPGQPLLPDRFDLTILDFAISTVGQRPFRLLEAP
jgi:hypothetical protein